MSTVCLSAKLRTPLPNGSLITAIKPKGKENYRTSLFYILHKNYTHRRYSFL
jgi:hypothetical protein